MRRPTLAPVVIVLAVLLLPAAYLGAYYALLAPPLVIENGGLPFVDNGSIYRLSNPMVEKILWPANYVDRKLRPKHWGED